MQVYWRPGCGACRAMRLALAEAGVAVEWHNIWEDRDASALVRSVASGNETVPTLVIDGRAHVAPSPRRALEEISRAAPHLVRHTNRWPPLRIVQWVAIITILVASELVTSSGQVGWSYVLDALAFLTYVGLRRLRSRPRESDDLVGELTANAGRPAAHAATVARGSPLGSPTDPGGFPSA